MTSYYIMHSGRHIIPSAIKEDDICIDDIAHHLTNTPRFCGAFDLGVQYSVASHSINLYSYAVGHEYPNINVLKGLLLHDASEAYLGDVNGILKKELPCYIALEARVQSLIYKKYNVVLSQEDEEIIDALDKRVLLDEAKAFLPRFYKDFEVQAPNKKPLGLLLESDEEPSLIKRRFLQHCKALGIAD